MQQRPIPPKESWEFLWLSLKQNRDVTTVPKAQYKTSEKGNKHFVKGHKEVRMGK